MLGIEDEDAAVIFFVFNIALRMEIHPSLLLPDRRRYRRISSRIRIAR